MVFVRFAQVMQKRVRQGFDLRSYNEMQRQEILRHKWIESEKAGRDLGQEAVLDWIRRYAALFRKAHGMSPQLEDHESWPHKLKERLTAAFR